MGPEECSNCAEGALLVEFGDIKTVWMKLVDADVEILPSPDGTVHVEALSESAFSLKKSSGELKILTSTGWKLRNLPRKNKERARLVVRVPGNVKVSAGMKRASLHAEGVSFGSLAIGETTGTLTDCTVRKLAVGPARLSGSIYVWERTEIALSMGSIELKVLELEAPIDVSVVMGSLRLSLPDDCDALIEVEGNYEGVILNSGRLLGSGEHRIQLSSMKGVIVVDTWGEFDDV
ncbi:DUF4097 domain-containing protein [Thermococcus sp. 21S9]|uniref:DUF4097 domain-containing protein n=1 Tax=Thermococcus sp. 21S9 TaxID=1638223 RepID=UPI001438B1B7|nr:DUF4097 domain-containing protein [Thermococcus sp. 21S9]NJE55347.1 hypothetical protein [Thermococcus sp. 21S9]